MRMLLSTLILGLATMPGIALAQTVVPSGAQTWAPPTATLPASKLPDNPEAKARGEAFRAACGADLKTHCATVAVGTEQSRAELRQCVEANKAKFSSACQAAVAAREANREARKQAQPAVGEKPKT